MHSFQVDSMDAMALLHNTAAAIGTRLDRTIATSHAKLLERIAQQDETLGKQQEMIKAISEQIVNQTRLPSPQWMPSISSSYLSSSFPYTSSSNVDPIFNIYMEMRHLKDIVEEGFKSSASSTKASLEDFRNATNKRFNNVENQLKELRFRNVHVRDTSLPPHGLHFHPSGSPTIVTNTQRWKNTTNGPPEPSRDLQDEYEEYYDEPLVCINPLDTVKNKGPVQNDKSTPRESSTQPHSATSLPPIDVSPDAGMSLGANSVPGTTPSYNPNDSPPLTTLSEPDHHDYPDESTGDVQGSSVPNAFSYQTVLLPRKRKRGSRAVHVPTSRKRSKPSCPKGRPRKQPRLDTEDARQSSRLPQASGIKGKRPASPTRETAQTSDDIWPKQGKANATSRQYIQCDRCRLWYHWGCVGIDRVDARRMTGDDTEYVCPPCTANVERELKLKQEATSGKEKCARPGCTIPETTMEEFFIERFVGRYDRCIPGSARYSWLIKWEGYSIDQCDWTPGDEIEAPDDLIDRFEKEAKSENAFHRESNLVLLKEAIKAGWDRRLQ